MFLYYFEQATRHSIRVMFSLFQCKNIFTFFSIGNRIFERKTVGQPLRCVNHNCNGRLVCAAEHYELFNVQDKVIHGATFSDGLQSLMNTTDCVTPLSEIDLEDLKKVILKSGSRQIIADKATQVISQFLPIPDQGLHNPFCN